MTLGERIRAKRQEKDWTQEELADRAGISSKGFVSDLENNKRGVSAETLFQVAQALAVSIDYLMTGSDEKQAAESISIPSALAQLASVEALSFRKTLALLEMRRQIIAHRTSGQQKDDLDTFDWRRFYTSVKEFLQ